MVSQRSGVDPPGMALGIQGCPRPVGRPHAIRAWGGHARQKDLRPSAPSFNKGRRLPNAHVSFRQGCVEGGSTVL